jgi:hypothetical protein
MSCDDSRISKLWQQTVIVGSTYGDEGEVKTHEDEIGLPAQLFQKDGSNHGHEEVPEPVCGDSNGLSI